MAIHEIGTCPTLRNTIGFFEKEPPQPKEDFRWLGSFELTRISKADIGDPTKLVGLAAVVFHQRAEKPNQIAREPEALSTLLDAGVPIFIVSVAVEAGKGMLTFRDMLVDALAEEGLPVDKGGRHKESVFSPAIHILVDPGKISEINIWETISESVQRYRSGAPPNVVLQPDVHYSPDTECELGSDDIDILRRAFWDCSQLKLIENPGGRSGVFTFRAYAMREGKDPVGTSRPYEFFVKVGNREQIAKEYSAYRQIALEHIPYHLGPRLRLDRCALGASRGVIVCDYVNGAEKLCDCAKDGRAVPIIANLFNTTLRTWRDNMTPIDTPLSEFLLARMPDDIPDRRQEKIEDLGRTHTPKEISAIVSRLGSTPVFTGFVHGDLHALNVMVRGGDAIVIDFEKAEEGMPLLRDLASLESGLFVDGFIGDRRTSKELLRSLDCLYSREALLGGRFDLCHPSDGSAWFVDCVRQIRIHAPQIERGYGQYALTLAAEYAKKACKDDDFAGADPLVDRLTGEDIRACAYILAQKILTRLSTVPEPPQA